MSALTAAETAGVLAEFVNRLVRSMRSYARVRGRLFKEDVELLALMEDRNTYSLEDLWRGVKGEFSPLDESFAYRLLHIANLGLIKKGIDEYTLTRRGHWFLSSARVRGHYGGILVANCSGRAQSSVPTPRQARVQLLRLDPHAGDRPGSRESGARGRSRSRRSS